MRKLEVIALTVVDAVQAQTGGAASLELVQNLAVGGLTPDLETVKAIRGAVTIPLRVIVRPHAASFVYSAADISQIVKDVTALKQIGADGIVFGALQPDGRVDLPLTRHIAQLSQPLEFTFHRAIDLCYDAESALPELARFIHRLLTSGHTANVWDGRETIRRWVSSYGDQFTIACGGGVHVEQLAELIIATHAPEFHVGTAAQSDHVVDVAKVAQMVKLVSA